MIPELNDREWYKGMVRVNVDRISLLKLIGILELVLRHLDLPDSIKQKGVEMGRSFASYLLDDGLVIPDQVRESWEATFNMNIKTECDRIIPGLTDQEGRPWK